MNNGNNYRSYQVFGINWMLSCSGDILLADEPGLGKTIQAAGYINQTNPKSILIVCPASLVLNWKQELNSWLTARPAKLDVVSYGQLFNSCFDHIYSSEKYDLAIYDEAHYLKDPDTVRSRLAFGVSASKKIYMTGTPVVNRPMDAYPILSHISPETWGDKKSFGKRFCGAELKPIKWSKARRINGRYIAPRPVKFAWDYSGASNLDELNSKLKATCMLRRRKADVLGELPPKIRSIIEIDAPNIDSAHTTDLFDQISAYTKWRGFKNYREKKINELRKVAFTALSKERLASAMHKAPIVAEYVVNALEEEPKIVIPAWHREVIDFLEKRLHEYGVVKLYGGMTAAQKDSAVKSFQQGDTRIFLAQYTSAGVGLTLHSSSRMISAEIDWVPGNVIQMEDRLHRMGQKKSVLIEHVVLANSIDSRLVKALVDKQAVIEQVLK